MARPAKCKRICGEPRHCRFRPMETETPGEVQMTVEEYETIRLIDYNGQTQEACAQQMKVARTTVQALYNKARQKLAEVVVEGKQLTIEGGNYEVCPKQNSCYKNGCCKNDCHNYAEE